MNSSRFKEFRNEDWMSTLMGLLLLLLVCIVPSWMPSIPKSLASFSDISALGGLWFICLLISGLGLYMMGERIRGYFIAFTGIFILAAIGIYLSSIPEIKRTGLESVFFSVAIGLLIRNTIGLPKWLSVAVRSEYFIKMGLILLGTSVLFNEIMKAGAWGMLQAIIVVLCVWYFTFWLSKRMKLDSEMGIMLASAVSICGVSAAIATCGAINGDSKKLSFVVSIVLVVAIPMMYLMPFLAKALGLSEVVAGAWLGGTIDTTGAVVASGTFLGETAERYSVIVKSSQNVLLGIAAFAISLYWSLRKRDQQERPTAKLIWDRFPKFVIGFILASLIFSLFLSPDTAKSLGSVAKGLRGALFAIAFVCIGLETDFREVFKKEYRKNTLTFLIAQGFNIILTLGVSYVLFGLIAKL